MFERELTDVMFLQRWGIVRTLMPQSIAEHTFGVAHYANDICVMLQLPAEVHLAVLKYALWHDVDEVFTGDMPGPNKRGLLDAIGPGAKAKWSERLKSWMTATFSTWHTRAGHGQHSQTAELVVKIADWLEASVKMATETQMGNACTQRHITPNVNGAIEVAHNLCGYLYGDLAPADEIPIDPTPGDKMFAYLREKITAAVDAAQFGHSKGPWITKEDALRTYKDPCVDA